MADETLRDHEGRIKCLEEQSYLQTVKLKEIETNMLESNQYLRELSTTQLDQNNQILKEVLKGNHESEARSDEAKRQQEQNRTELWKLVLGSGGVAGVLVVIVQYIIQAII